MESVDGNFSQIYFWKIKNKLCPPSKEAPMAKIDEKGNIITAQETLRKLYLDTYTKRLKHREMDDKLLDVYFLKTDLWKSRLHMIRKLKTPPWTKSNVEMVLRSMKNNKTIDPNGIMAIPF